ncbi:MAG: ribonuclease HII [Propionibacteriaceae bacterium]|nr:ribonuclease HII [Propionibacteriaceae bacterium]
MAYATVRPSFSLAGSVYEVALTQAGFHRIAGADEAGRGACAGPLVAAAVILGDSVPDGLNDSKKLTPRRREQVFAEISDAAVALAWVSVPPAGCDALGIQSADLGALRDAVLALDPAPDFAVTDGFAVPGLKCPSLGMWKGDQVVACVAAASIVAKVVRDRMMVALDAEYPGYGFAVHKGYATQSHQAALNALGPCPEHRLTYRNVAATLPGMDHAETIV